MTFRYTIRSAGASDVPRRILTSIHVRAEIRVLQQPRFAHAKPCATIRPSKPERRGVRRAGGVRKKPAG